MWRVTSARESPWIEPFTGLTPAQFRKLVRTVAARGGAEIADDRPARQWSLELADRVLLVTAYWRRRTDQIAIVDGMLVPLRDHRWPPNRRTANLQVAIDADTRLVIALGTLEPGNRGRLHRLP